ncbi:MAG: hypothetical protein RDU13_11045 [Elusimicrobiales bacterium]|nr:hypothetical protein [Elusimicrobiales bacterium]
MKLKLTLVSAVLLTPALACAARAQWVPPEVEVTPLSAARYPHIEEDETSSGTEAGLSALKAKSAASEDIARIKVLFKGKWFQGADYLAREKAAALGANYLILLQSTGDEDLGAGAVRTYRAVRLLDFNGAPLYVRQETRPSYQPQPAAPLAENPQAALPAAGAQAGGHKHFAWVWRKDAHKLSHLAVFDPARAAKADTEELKSYVRENFPAKEYQKLLRSFKKNSRFTVDLNKREIR